MKLLINLMLVFICTPTHAKENSVVEAWKALTQDVKAEVLTFESELPVAGLKVVDLVQASDLFVIDQVSDAAQKSFAQKMIATFEKEVSTEEIEQSEYQANGEPRITELFLLVAPNGQVLGGKISYFQDGLDQDGEEGDISWQASIRTDANADILRNEEGQEYDDLYFEWSGH